MKLPLAILFVFLPLVSTARVQNYAAMNDVKWNSLGTNENSSMPLGNGDIAINFWTEQNGDLLLLLAKSDAWSENGELLKLGRVRVKLEPNPFVAPASVTQTLKLETGEIELHAGRNLVRVWVDANHPVVHLEVQTAKPTRVRAKNEVWRSGTYHLDPNGVLNAGLFEWSYMPNGLTFEPDTILPAGHEQISWCHFNSNSIFPLVFEREHLGTLLSKYPDPLLHRCFGVTMKGPDLISTDDLTLTSQMASKSHRIDFYALTKQAPSPETWGESMTSLIASIERTGIKAAKKAHQQWWTNFWDRSWIQVTGTPEALAVSQGYAIQRFMTACAGRGAHPIKFNGSLFTVGHDLPQGTSSTAEDHDPDFRIWGACYWNQNTRLIYWPLLASGDDDLLAPWFDMYVQAIPLVKDRTKDYFHHEGGVFIETMYFWGLPNVHDFGWDNKGPETESAWVRYYIQGELEVLAQMLDRYEYTQDDDFARNVLLPMADAIVPYYAQHWKQGPDGKLLIEPASSLETYQLLAVDPTPEIAGLMCALPRLLSLPSRLTQDTQRTLWRHLLTELPSIPLGKTSHGKLPEDGRGDPNGKTIILPASKYGGRRNTENPQLYPVFPYRIYGVGKPHLDLARNTYGARLFPFSICWGQDGMESATLGMADDAKKAVVHAFTCYGNERFPWFWAQNNDWIPDMDNGGCGMMTLELMLMQCDGRRIQLLPAWPQDWTADFKLHAPYKTTVEGHVENGKISNLRVIPQERTKDVVVVMTSQHASLGRTRLPPQRSSHDEKPAKTEPKTGSRSEATQISLRTHTDPSADFFH